MHLSLSTNIENNCSQDVKCIGYALVQLNYPQIVVLKSSIKCSFLYSCLLANLKRLPVITKIGGANTTSTLLNYYTMSTVDEKVPPKRGVSKRL